MDRREFLGTVSLGLLAAPLIAEAQPGGKVWRIGYLTPFSLTGTATEAFRQGLRNQGYVDGRNVVVEYRTAGQDDARLPALAAELLALRPDIIVAQTGSATAALKTLTTTTPIVMAGAADAVASGLVRSLARPGGNVTGYTWLTPDLVPKRVQILKEALPGLSRIVALGCAGPVTQASLDHARSAGRTLGMTVEAVEYRGRASWAETEEEIGKARPEALFLLDCPELPFQAIGEFTRRRRLPAISPWAGVARFGWLLDYGADPWAMTRSAVVFVKKILDGARPAELPVEQPTKFGLVINLKAAKALGLTIPPSVLARADEVIEQ